MYYKYVTKQFIPQVQDDYVTPAFSKTTVKRPPPPPRASASPKKSQGAKASSSLYETITNLQSDLDKQRMYVRNFRKMYVNLQEEIKEEKKKRKMAEIR